MRIRRGLIAVAIGVVVGMAVSAVANDQTPGAANIKWQQGPSIGDLGGVAEIRVPAGYVFAGPDDARVALRLMQNPTSGRELGLLASSDLAWFVLFEFDDVGYVRDDEKGFLDAAAMLEAVKRGTEESNKERRRRGWPIMTILGWQQKPHYDETTHNLEWAIRGESEGAQVINHNTRLLGREGVMRVTLVSDPNIFTATLPQFKALLGGYDFKQGHTYSEFRPGDKVAKYGLSALVVGGATALALKTGLFKWLWKIIVAVVLAVVAFVKRVFSGKKPEQVSQ